MASPVPASGSSSGSTPQGSSQNTSASRRTRSVGTKLTDEEYAQLEALAATQGVTPGEWVRELVLRAFGQPAAEATVAEQTVLSEVLALRTILINIIYDQANGHEIARERMRELIAKADAGKYCYDALDDLTGVYLAPGVNCASPGTAARSFGYSSLKRLLSAANPETGPVSYTYDADGNLSTRAMGGNTTHYCYDQLNQLTGKFYASGSCTSPTVSYTYAAGWRTASSVSGGTSTSSTYDGLGRVATSSQTTNGVTYSFPQYLWNLADGPVSEEYPSGRVVATDYDSGGQPNKVTGTLSGVPAAYAGCEPSAPTVCVEYAPHGAVQQIPMGNGILEATLFNARLQPCEIQVASTGGSLSCTPATPSAGTLLTINYDYGGSTNNGNVASQTISRLNDTGGQSTWTQSYVYDGVNRLTCANEASGLTAPTCGTGSPGWAENYGYDIVGNQWISGTPTGLAALTSETPQSNGAFGSTTCIGGIGSSCTGGVWAGSPNNQVVLSGWTYDGSGNVTQAGSSGLQFGYDAENRQTSATINMAAMSYTYDADGRRVTKMVAGQGTTVYVYDGSGVLAADYPAVPQSTATTYLTADALGSTRLETGTGAAVARCSDYLPFGADVGSGVDVRPSCFTTPPTPEVKFTGKERDAESGLDYFGARYFSGAQGRFTSPDSPFNDQDPSDPQSWNLYGYVRNNPLRSTDPTGEDCVSTSNQTETSVTVSVVAGGCGAQGGTFVNGTVDTNSLTYNGKSLDIGYTGYSGAVGVLSKNLGAPVYEFPGIEGPANLAGAAHIGASQSLINGFAAADAAFAVGYLATYAPAAIGTFRAAQAAQAAAQAAAALKAAQLALKALPPDQYRLLQQWLGPIKAGSSITPPPPGLTPDAMQRYLAVAQAYVAAGGSGAAIQATRIQALNAALGNK